METKPKYIIWQEKIWEYLKSNFSKRNNLLRLVVFVFALIIVIIPSIIMLEWCQQQTIADPFGPNGFWSIYIINNDGVSFGMFSDNPSVAIGIQWTTNIILLIALLFVDKWYYILLLSFATIGGFFNAIQRLIPWNYLGNFGVNGVCDYFKFDFWPGFGIFNFPDIFVVCGIFGFVIIFIIMTIINLVEELKIEKLLEGKKKKEDGKNHS